MTVLAAVVWMVQWGTMQLFTLIKDSKIPATAHQLMAKLSELKNRFQAHDSSQTDQTSILPESYSEQHLVSSGDTTLLSNKTECSESSSATLIHTPMFLLLNTKSPPAVHEVHPGQAVSYRISNLESANS